MATPTTARPKVLPKPPSTAPRQDIAAWRASLKAAIAWDKANTPEKHAKQEAKAEKAGTLKPLQELKEAEETTPTPPGTPKSGDTGSDTGDVDDKLEAMKSAARAEESAQAKSDKELQDEMRGMIGKAAGGTA